MAPPQTAMEVVDDTSQPSSSGMNKNAKHRRAEKFRARKNIGQAKAIANRIDNSLRNPALPSPRSNVIPQVVPITFVGLPDLCNDVWFNMASRGTRNFDRWFRGLEPDFQHGLHIFKKILLYAALAKLQLAQKRDNCHPQHYGSPERTISSSA
ncbi:uncharacterized protein LOC113471711 [Diaphorina citri]|uniref:Uncharacterized protein LOC113471711 n=1 Tax=Diaphorina citri TaxID=121845 RepID=A0A3Q0JEN6_DIACI|nr:uncharacterized protein LOC113471711 [Diaphorina citri]